MGSKAGRIAELVNEYQHITDRDYVPMDSIQVLIELMYDGQVDWEGVKQMAKADLKF